MRAVVIRAAGDLRAGDRPSAAVRVADEGRAAIARGGIGGPDLRPLHHGHVGAVGTGEPRAPGLGTEAVA